VLAVVLANGTLNALAAEDVVTVAAVDMAEVPDVSVYHQRLMFAVKTYTTVRAVCRTVMAPPVLEAELPLYAGQVDVCSTVEAYTTDCTGSL
jgi:hypothetical protein